MSRKLPKISEQEWRELEASSEIINQSAEWSTEEEAMYNLPKHPNRSIWLGGPVSGRYMMISNDKPIIDALAQHKWTFEMCEYSGGCRPINVDQTSTWKRAEDLVAYTLLKAMKDTKGRPLVSSPEHYFDVVHVLPHDRAMHDLRSHRLYIRFRKISKAKLLANKIANDKHKAEEGDSMEARVRKQFRYLKSRLKHPQEDFDDGVLNNVKIPLGVDPLADQEDEVVTVFKEIMEIQQRERDRKLTPAAASASSSSAASASSSASSSRR